MSDLFQIPIGTGHQESDNPFARFGLEENPFPSAGVDSGVLYQDHMKKELGEVNAWIKDVGTATDPTRKEVGSIRPLAIYGSIGVGKTHLLSYLQRGLSGNPSTPVLRKGLADEGMSRLVLANLFLRYLPFQDEADEPGTGLIKKIVDAARKRKDASEQDALLGVLREGSPIKIPFKALFRQDLGNDGVTWLSRWLRREYTTPAQRGKLGIAGVLQSEGQAVRAVADLLRLANAAGHVRVWFVMIDQLEELWRPGVITSSRRARFLTDLRHLVDQALEGAPIALLLAWNTTVAETLFQGDVGAKIRADYLALWERLTTPVDLPALGESDVWPFAKTYLLAAGVHDRADEKKVRLYNALRNARDSVVEAIKAVKPGKESPITPRDVLAAWRRKAIEIAEQEGT